MYVALGANVTNVFCYTDDGTVGFGITDSTSGQFQGVPFFDASNPPRPRIFFQKRVTAAPGFMVGYELNAHDYVGPQHIVGCSSDIVQARIVVGSKILCLTFSWLLFALILVLFVCSRHPFCCWLGSEVRAKRTPSLRRSISPEKGWGRVLPQTSLNQLCLAPIGGFMYHP